MDIFKSSHGGKCQFYPLYKGDTQAENYYIGGILGRLLPRIHGFIVSKGEMKL